MKTDLPGALERFFLLLRTPIGKKEALRRAGLIEIPGTGTVELPQGEPSEDDVKQDDLPASYPNHEGGGGVATATMSPRAMVRSLGGGDPATASANRSDLGDRNHDRNVRSNETSRDVAVG